MSYVGTVLTRRFVYYAFNGLLYALIAWTFTERFNRDPRRLLLFIIVFAFVLTSFGLHHLSGRRFLPLKFGFVGCIVLGLLTLRYLHLVALWGQNFVYVWASCLAIAQFFPARPPLGPWWPAAKRTIRMLRGDSREEDERFKAKILASVKPAGTPQK
jgi:hypothetical protein